MRPRLDYGAVIYDVAYNEILNQKLNTRNTDKITLFIRNITFSELKFIRPSTNSVCNCHNCKVIKYLARLRCGLNHLREQKSRHGFQDTLNPFSWCGLDVETNTHFFLSCPLIL